MFDNIVNLYEQIVSLDLSIDRKYYYERIVYLAMYKILYNQIELINARDYHPVYLIIPLECMGYINKLLLNKFQTCNDNIVSDMEKEQRELLEKLNAYNNLHMDTISNQNDIMSTGYIYKINLHCARTRLIANSLELCTIIINVLSNVFINPIQFGCLLWFIDSVMSDMMETLVDTADKFNRDVTEIEIRNDEVAQEFIDNKNIIYECMEENNYLEKIRENIHNHFNIRKDVAQSYKINAAYTDVELTYQRKVLLLTWVIPKSMFLTWIYTDLKQICNQLVLSLISYKDYDNKLKRLNIDKQTDGLITKLPDIVIINPKLLNNDVLFKICHLSYKFDDTVLFKNDGDLIIPSMKWITLRGESGSGKTTLCNMLLKTIPTDAKITFLNEYDNYDYNSIRHLISNVKPNSDLFSRSIDFNLKFGVKDNTSECVNKDIHKYLVLFGLDNLTTRLNDHIDDLSTGEKQRIKIIRCILQDKPIWFLDEITSNLDPECEETVMMCLRQIQQEKKKSVIHISHNSDLIKYSDCRIVIEDANISISLA
jgi:ABC-type multidrug transport system fused ATPase/permease subunit